jgi:hypothetical protein
MDCNERLAIKEFDSFFINRLPVYWDAVGDGMGVGSGV